ncbi:GNAT family N-acetyltransferase [Alicyclobacillus fodiniaquatilis]|uniref:Enhanced intracellular survival protein Eis n=1 Tax=Alicyclobacillus fodiniaquatilis TaxID=1661150 RepID=A0ABW4JL82_9BACL
MSRQFQKLDLSFVDSIVHTAVHAYPGQGQSEAHQQHIKEWATNSIVNWPWQDLFGIVEEGELLASLCLFTMDFNVRGCILTAGGIGSVQTALLHRKRGVAYDMIQSALRHYRAHGVSLVTLYPFRAGFYRKMGFGYGAEVRQYQVSPKDFPHGETAGSVRELTGTNADRQATIDCYDEFFRRTHGMSARLDRSLGDVFAPDKVVMGYEEEGVLKGYLVLAFVCQHALKSDLKLVELVHHTPDALKAFSAFLHRQMDQFEKIIIETQDDTLQFMLEDIARHTYDTFASRYVETCSIGLGLMYRVVDVAGMFRAVENQPFDVTDVTLKLDILDDFLPENSGTTIVKFENGRAMLVSDGPWDVEVSMDVASFSSLWMGAVDLRSLLRLGLATVSALDWVPVLQRLFRTDTKPMCWGHF